MSLCDDIFAGIQYCGNVKKHGIRNAKGSVFEILGAKGMLFALLGASHKQDVSLHICPVLKQSIYLLDGIIYTTFAVHFIRYLELRRSYVLLKV